MARLLTILSIIFAILFFPPATLALISNNAVPGDATYPIKRGLEEVILKIASVTPQSKTWFSIQRSDRRFEESKILLIAGKTQSSDSLEELVAQTQLVAEEISQIQDPVKKEELTKQLTSEIKKYDEGLEKVKQEISSIPAPSSPPETSTPIPSQTIVSPKPSAHPQPTSIQPSPTVKPTSRPSASPTIQPTTRPTSTPLPTSTPQPSSSPAPSPPSTPSLCDGIADPIERARCKLKEIQYGLRAESSKDKSFSNTEEENKKEDKNLTPKVDTDKKEKR